MISYKYNMDHAENEQSIKKSKSNIARFAAAAVATILLAAGWFLAWAYISYRFRLSVDVIRAGLLLLYIAPCAVGGRLLHHLMRRNVPLEGAALGVVLYAVIVVLSVAEHTQITPDRGALIRFLLCALSGAIGSFSMKQ